MVPLRSMMFPVIPQSQTSLLDLKGHNICSSLTIFLLIRIETIICGKYPYFHYIHINNISQKAGPFGTTRNILAALFIFFYFFYLCRECWPCCRLAFGIFYNDAINDLDVSKIVESSLARKCQIESELKTLFDQYSSMVSPSVQHIGPMADEPNQINLQCVNTPDKARGMNSMSNIPLAPFFHSEEPYAMPYILQIILKSCRETHCHYYLNELLVNKVPCPSCSIPLYYSQNCQLQVGYKISHNYPKDDGIHKHLSVLPSEIVLASRVFIKSIIQRRGSSKTANLRENLDLSHHYSQISLERKLELHIYSTVLLYYLSVLSCLWFLIVIIVSQIRVNSMTIVCIKSIDVHDLVDQYGKSSLGALTSNVEQPNIHAYFISCTLLIQTIEFVATRCPLELSYEVNLSDLFLNAFHCDEPNYYGIILDSGNNKLLIKKYYFINKISAKNCNKYVGDENELLSKAFASAEEEKKSLYLDGLLAARSYAEIHFSTQYYSYSHSFFIRRTVDKKFPTWRMSR
ncbi:hypothetical protein UlMin_009929 [Ulmus minor]